MNSKLEEALNLSEEVLNQLEDANIKTSVIALKCLRLARLMDDYESVDWLVCEMEGYKSTKDGIPPERKAPYPEYLRIDVPVDKEEIHHGDRSWG